jgi:hypothetical protein
VIILELMDHYMYYLFGILCRLFVIICGPLHVACHVTSKKAIYLFGN